MEKAIDGDTLKIRTPNGQRVSVRVQGIDCPESKANKKCMKQGEKKCKADVPKGCEAGRIAAALVKQKTVVFEATKGSGELDKGVYGRPLAYVRMPDGRDFGLTMVKMSACQDYRWKYPHPRSEEYKAAK